MQNFNNLMRTNAKMLSDDEYATSYIHDKNFLEAHKEEVAQWSKKQQECSIKITMKEFKLYPKNKTILLTRAIEKAKELLTQEAHGDFNDEAYVALFKKHFYRRLKASKIHIKQMKNLPKGLESYLTIINILRDVKDEYNEMLLDAMQTIEEMLNENK
ncbi:hypothetical protein [Sulfurimonas xiamenensis]|uniref:Uncharacterized protein n=1 Tax=Sulfurimonas xiamenensis TaxID=2590021 RepID=A0AAJ4DN24_9BACT|nr:hypothetical protein [Sulfurimonas xiamenensis]QFR43762.1 hypothetical protein FJR47_07500 [Sulfurimonas xiamenensis]